MAWAWLETEESSYLAGMVPSDDGDPGLVPAFLFNGFKTYERLEYKAK